MGSNFLSSAKATLNASTRILSLVAWADRYLAVALLRLLFSSLLRGCSALHFARSSPSAGSSEVQPADLRPLSIVSGSDWVQERSASAWSGLSIIFPLWCWRSLLLGNLDTISHYSGRKRKEKKTSYLVELKEKKKMLIKNRQI